MLLGDIKTSIPVFTMIRREITPRADFRAVVPADVCINPQLMDFKGPFLTQQFERHVVPKRDLVDLFTKIQYGFNQKDEWFDELPSLHSSGRVRRWDYMSEDGVKTPVIIKYTGGSAYEGHNTQQFRDAFEFLFRLDNAPKSIGFQDRLRSHGLPELISFPKEGEGAEYGFELKLPHVYNDLIHKSMDREPLIFDLNEVFPFTKDHLVMEEICGVPYRRLITQLKIGGEDKTRKTLEDAFSGFVDYVTKSRRLLNIGVSNDEIRTVTPETMKKLKRLEGDNVGVHGPLEGLMNQFDQMMVAGTKTYPNTEVKNWVFFPTYDVI